MTQSGKLNTVPLLCDTSLLVIATALHHFRQQRYSWLRIVCTHEQVDYIRGLCSEQELAANFLTVMFPDELTGIAYYFNWHTASFGPNSKIKPILTREVLAQVFPNGDAPPAAENASLLESAFSDLPADIRIPGLTQELSKESGAQQSTDAEDAQDCEPNSNKLSNGFVFEEDHRKNLPMLHLFHVEQALVHLREIDLSIMRLSSLCNLNMHVPIEGLQQARMKLVDTKAAYYQADRMLKSLRLVLGHWIVDDDEGARVEVPTRVELDNREDT